MTPLTIGSVYQFTLHRTHARLIGEVLGLRRADNDRPDFIDMVLIRVRPGTASPGLRGRVALDGTLVERCDAMRWTPVTKGDA